jgi:hypothetical protein
MRLAARGGERMPRAFLDTETLGMLMRGNVASDADMRRLLGRAGRDVLRFVPPPFAEAVRRDAALHGLLPVLRGTVAATWLIAGVVSLGPYPVERSYALLARTGIRGRVAPAALYGAALLDLAFGVATLWPRRPRALWWSQLALVAGYTAIITRRLPEYWLHPYGPVAKNLPFMAALWLLATLDRPAGR